MVALGRLVDSYVYFTLSHSDVIAALIGDIDHLDSDRRGMARRAQHDYITHWVDRLGATEPGLAPVAARIEAQAAIMIANNIAQTPHLRALPDLAATLAQICRAVGHVEEAL